MSWGWVAMLLAVVVGTWLGTRKHRHLVSVQKVVAERYGLELEDGVAIGEIAGQSVELGLSSGEGKSPWERLRAEADGNSMWLMVLAAGVWDPWFLMVFGSGFVTTALSTMVSAATVLELRVGGANAPVGLALSERGFGKTQRTGDEAFDQDVGVDGAPADVRSHLDAPTRRSAQWWVGEGGEVNNGLVEMSFGRKATAEQILEAIPRGAELVERLGTSTDHQRLIDIAMDDPVEEVQIVAASTLLDEVPDLAGAVHARALAGREPVEALADGGGTALVAVRLLARSGGMSEIAALRSLTEHPSALMREAVSEALAAIRMRIGERAQGGVSLAAPTGGGLSEVEHAARAAKTPLRQS